MLIVEWKKAFLREVQYRRFELIASKDEASTTMFDKLNMNIVGATNVSCEICGNVGHIGTGCQLGNFISQELAN